MTATATTKTTANKMATRFCGYDSNGNNKDKDK
jgi:hypothetical protein